MSSTGYIPASDSDKGVWINNFSVKIGGYAPAVGITPAEVTAVQKDAAMYQYVLNLQGVFRQTLQNITAYKSLLKHASAQQHLGALPTLPALAAAPAGVPEGVFDRISRLVQRIKASASYTDNMGSDLGIIAPANVLDPDAMQPVLSVKPDAGRPHIRWTKGSADTLALYVDRNDGAGYTLMGNMTGHDFIDTASLAAGKVIDEWHYKAVYLIANQPVGQYSAVASITVKKL
jgi:hypothetical protein